jgi:hypothetical protein
MSLLTIEEAGEVLAKETGRSTARGSFRHILMAGAGCRLRVYWRNSEQRFSRLFGFAGEVVGSSRVIREMQVPASALGKLETRPGIRITMFEPANEDWALLEKLQSLDDEGHPSGFRALEDGAALVTIETLLVFEAEVRQLGLTQLTRPGPETLALPGKGTHETPPFSSERWTVKKPERWRGYNLPLYRSLVAAHRAGRAVPTAREILQEWKAKPPADLLEVARDWVTYERDGEALVASVKSIAGAISRLVKRR